jgi:hypothetical protein
MIVLDLSILNQKGTPMFNSDLTANRPAAGIVGRIFIAIDSPYGIFRDTGTGWDQISSAGGADTNIYNTDGTLTGTRTVSSGGFQLVFNPQTTFFSSLTASTGASSFSVLGSNALTFAAGFSSSNIGNVYSANGAINAQNFLGNATFAQANLASAMVNVNKIDFGSGGHTITMTQSTAPGIRAMTGVQNQIQFTGSHNGTISHAAISQNLGFFRESGSTRTLTITNAYSLLINPLDDYGAGFTFTNRWGIYQAGPSDINYFAARVGIGTNAPTADLDVRGSFEIARFGTTGSDNYINVKNTTGDFYIGADSTRAYIWTTTATPIDFITANVVKMKLFNTGNLVLQSGGTFVDGGQRLQVQGTSFFNGYALFGTGNTGTPLATLADFRGGSDNDFIQVARVSTSSDRYFRIYANGYVDALSTKTDSPAYNFAGSANANTSGNRGLFSLTNTFNPTSGNATYATFAINQTINQTGGSNGITRGLYINPTITAAADWRAIEINTGISVLAPATTASATLRVPSGTAPTSPVDGDIWFNGTNLFMRIGGVTKTFTII